MAVIKKKASRQKIVRKKIEGVSGIVEFFVIAGKSPPLQEFLLDTTYEKTPMPKDKIIGTAHMEKVENPASPALRAKFVRFLDGAYTKLHYHSAGQVLFCTEGEGFVEFNGHEYKLVPGSRAIIPPGTLHRHGAGHDRDMVHLAVTAGHTVWQDKDKKGNK